MSNVAWDHSDVGGTCVVCGSIWPCAAWVEDREMYDREALEIVQEWRAVRAAEETRGQDEEGCMTAPAP